jgi:hypothetical protein
MLPPFFQKLSKNTPPGIPRNVIFLNGFGEVFSEVPFMSLQHANTSCHQLEHLFISIVSRFVKIIFHDESFRQGWQEAMHDETLPVSELWEDIDAE